MKVEGYLELGRRSFLQLIPGAALAASGVRATALAADEPLRVGSILSVTGPAAFLGEDMKAGSQLAVDEINASRRHRRPQDRLDLLRRAKARRRRRFRRRAG